MKVLYASDFIAPRGQYRVVEANARGALFFGDSAPQHTLVGDYPTQTEAEGIAAQVPNGSSRSIYDDQGNFIDSTSRVPPAF